MNARESRSFRVNAVEMADIARAAVVLGIRPATLVRNAALAAARRVLEAATGEAALLHRGEEDEC